MWHPCPRGATRVRLLRYPRLYRGAAPRGATARRRSAAGRLGCPGAVLPGVGGPGPAQAHWLRTPVGDGFRRPGPDSPRGRLGGGDPQPGARRCRTARLVPRGPCRAGAGSERGRAGPELLGVPGRALSAGLLGAAPGARDGDPPGGRPAGRGHARRRRERARGGRGDAGGRPGDAAGAPGDAASARGDAASAPGNAASTPGDAASPAGPAAPGTGTPFDPAFAADGVDELLMGFLTRKIRRGSWDGLGGSLAIHADDGAAGRADWLIEGGPGAPGVSRGASRADCDVAGPASGLYLMLWNRRPADQLQVTGAPGILAAVNRALHITWS